LSWNASATATNYYVKRSTTSGNGYVAIATNLSLTFTNNGLVNGTLYYYSVSAVNSSGEGGNSSEVSARPTSFAPVTLSVISSASRIHLSWPADHTGWSLQAQTNSLASGLGTNWSDVAGSTHTNHFIVPFDMINDTVFFRLARP
jgi:hypothetical protein